MYLRDVILAKNRCPRRRRMSRYDGRRWTTIPSRDGNPQSRLGFNRPCLEFSAMPRPRTRGHSHMLGKPIVNTFTHARPGDTPWVSDGLRSFFEYRDLGTPDATGSPVNARGSCLSCSITLRTWNIWTSSARRISEQLVCKARFLFPNRVPGDGQSARPRRSFGSARIERPRTGPLRIRYQARRSAPALFEPRRTTPSCPPMP